MEAHRFEPRLSRGAKFPLGRVVATPGALRALEVSGVDPLYLLSRHQAGSWGTLCTEDRDANDRALETGLRILSCYGLAPGVSIWIITEWDRSVTTLLLPEEY